MKPGAIIFAILLVLHFVDKRIAVTRAIDGYVAITEVETVKAELSEVKRRNAIIEKANVKLFTDKKATDLEIRVFEKELQDYAAQAHPNPDCVVTDDLFDKLR